MIGQIGADQVKFVPISLTATGDLVAAVSGRKIRVISYLFICSAALTINFESNTTDVTGPMQVAANGGVSYPGGVLAPAFETATGEKLAMTITGTGNVRGHLSYILV